MRYGKVCLETVGYHLPEEVLTSSDIESQLSPIYEALNIQPGRLELLTGVKERRIWPIGTRPSTVASEAAKMALSQSELEAKDIDLLMHTGVCRDALEPATACVVANNLKLDPHCMLLDISNACLGFLNGITLASNMIELGQIDNAMIVSGENAGPIYNDVIADLLKNPSFDNIRNNLASMTLGSGAVAFILRRKEHFPSGHSILGGIAQNDSSGHHYCEGQGDIYHQRMKTDTSKMMSKGLILSQITWELFKQELSWDNETPAHILNHQVSLAHQQKAFELLKLDPKKGYCDLRTLGNTGSVATPLSLAMRSQKGVFKKGEKLALLGIGSGLNCLMLGVEW